MKYLIQPGWVISKYDGDRHWVTAPMVARLYRLRPDEWRQYDSFWDRDTDLIILYPKSSGDYTL